MTHRRRILLLGSTGSIGRQTLEVVAHLNAMHDRGQCESGFEIVGLAAGSQTDLLAEQCRTLNVTRAAIANDRGQLDGLTVFRGAHAAEQLVRETDADLVVAAMVGAAGLPATLAAVELGRDVAIANKETLVAAGALVVPACHKSGARLLPIDSEHAAVWQCLAGVPDLCPPCEAPESVARVILTASGGPFRGRDPSEVYHATTEQSLAHPTWSMGPKITIDSATLMNKALEVIEAHWLFGLTSSKIQVVVHPQSVVHSLVEFDDGSVMAQFAAPDMRGPIQAALTFPKRVPSVATPLDFASLSALEFTPVNESTHRALALAKRAIDEQGSAGATINAANEAAVHAFLSERIAFGQIVELAERAAQHFSVHAISSLDDVLQADAEARAFVESEISA